VMFQCSSASRKFLNTAEEPTPFSTAPSFSALQRAENSSISSAVESMRLLPSVSVLFSEPKIPQLKAAYTGDVEGLRFSALQRAENSSMETAYERVAVVRSFSALQRAENSSMRWGKSHLLARMRFSALQRAENSSIRQRGTANDPDRPSFSALQRAENSSM